MVSFVTKLRAYDAFDLPRARYLWRSYSAGASVVVCAWVCFCFGRGARGFVPRRLWPPV